MERRFEPSRVGRSRWLFVVGWLGSAALGAGVFGIWLAHPTLTAAQPLFWAGLAVSVASVLLSPAHVPAVRVGTLGVALGESGDEVRLPWWDVQRVSIRGGSLTVQGSAAAIGVPLAQHAAAAARIVSEAARRVGDRVDVSPADHERLPAPRDDDSREVATRVQLAGRRCRASDRPITFERDARLCDNCGATYHVEQFPVVCNACGHSTQTR